MISITNHTIKPKRTVEDLIIMMRDEKGIQFNICSEQEAALHLRERNNYLRTAAYRKNYQTHIKGENVGKYIGLDFAYLIELSKLDMYLRNILLKLCIDLEHALKVHLLASIEANLLEDGYTIVDSFYADHKYIFDGIAKKHTTPYTGELVKKYFHIKDLGNPTAQYDVDCPAWVLTELLSFNELIQFYEHYCELYAISPLVKSSILRQAKNLRNACAHNNCLFSSLEKGQTKPSQQIQRFVADLRCVGKGMQNAKLTNRALYEIMCLLYSYTECVSKDVKTAGLLQLRDFTNLRLAKHLDYFQYNSTILTSFEFLNKVVDKLVQSAII